MTISKKLLQLSRTAVGMTAFGGAAAAWLVPAAYAARGYWAVGGEWLLIALAGAVGAWIMDKQ